MACYLSFTESFSVVKLIKAIEILCNIHPSSQTEGTTSTCLSTQQNWENMAFEQTYLELVRSAFQDAGLFSLKKKVEHYSHCCEMWKYNQAVFPEMQNLWEYVLNYRKFQSYSATSILSVSQGFQLTWCGTAIKLTRHGFSSMCALIN